mmetsp:Transcript_98601/g.307124  ORF Transcript_98601/g.307124 Transcript_98601/m.307124 type:complete len:301 (+) Transcript_98601:544-1446(+)
MLTVPESSASSMVQSAEISGSDTVEGGILSVRRRALRTSSSSSWPEPSLSKRPKSTSSCRPACPVYAAPLMVALSLATALGPSVIRLLTVSKSAAESSALSLPSGASLWRLTTFCALSKSRSASATAQRVSWISASRSLRTSTSSWMRCFMLAAVDLRVFAAASSALRSVSAAESLKRAQLSSTPRTLARNSWGQLVRSRWSVSLCWCISALALSAAWRASWPARMQSASCWWTSSSSDRSRSRASWNASWMATCGGRLARRSSRLSATPMPFQTIALALWRSSMHCPSRKDACSMRSIC